MVQQRVHHAARKDGAERAALKTSAGIFSNLSPDNRGARSRVRTGRSLPACAWSGFSGFCPRVRRATAGRSSPAARPCAPAQGNSRHIGGREAPSAGASRSGQSHLDEQPAAAAGRADRKALAITLRYHVLLVILVVVAQ